MVPCLLVTFEKEQIVVWRGKDYKPPENDACFVSQREMFDSPESDSEECSVEGHDSTDESTSQQGFNSGDSGDDDE